MVKFSRTTTVVELKEIRATERIVVAPHNQIAGYSSKEFYAECTKVIELTGEGKITEKPYPHKRYIPCELAPSLKRRGWNYFKSIWKVKQYYSIFRNCIMLLRSETE